MVMVENEHNQQHGKILGLEKHTVQWANYQATSSGWAYTHGTRIKHFNQKLVNLESLG